MPTDRTQQLVLALVATALVGLVATTHPGTIPVLTLCAGVFVALAALLKL
jgi:hypothetical protein